MAAAGTVDGRRVCKPSATKGPCYSCRWARVRGDILTPLARPFPCKTLHFLGYFHRPWQVLKKHLQSTHTEPQTCTEDSAAWHAGSRKYRREGGQISLCSYPQLPSVAITAQCHTGTATPIFVAKSQDDLSATVCSGRGGRVSE